MHRAESIVSHIYYGFDLKNLFIRLDSNRDLREEHVNELSFGVHFLKPVPYRMDVRIDPTAGTVNATITKIVKGQEAVPEQHTSIAAHDIVEMSIPFDSIEAKPKDEVNFFVTVRRGDVELEKWPYRGYISLNVPTEDFEAIMWHV